jgi:hypothetical protein
VDHYAALRRGIERRLLLGNYKAPVACEQGRRHGLNEPETAH